MSSTFMGLNIAYTGLQAANAALNTTANNVSNVETEGYSRQYVVQEAAEALRTFQTYGCAGAGVQVLAVERYRDVFYDEKYWQNNSYLGEYEVKQYYMALLEDYFADEGDDGIQGFNTIFDNMYAALEDLKNDSSTDSTRRAFLGVAEELTEYFNTLAANLQALQEDANEEIKVYVDRISAIAQEIATLNKEINVIELSGDNANELRDQRDLLIDELSLIVDTEVEEQTVVDANGNATGATRYIVKIAGGQTLVDGTTYNTLSCVARDTDEKVNQSDADGLYDIVWSNGNTFSLTNSSIGGKLQGLIELRDGNNGEYFNGTVTGTDVRTIDGVKHSVVTVTVTDSWLEDINKCTLPSSGVITIGSRELYYDSWTLNYDADTDTYSYEFILSDSSKNENTSVSGLMGKEASVGYSVDYQGIPYYMEQMNEWIRSFAQAFNDILTQDGAVDNYGDDAQILFTGNSATDTTQYTFSASNAVVSGESYSISSTSDSYYLLTAFNFAVSAAMLDDPNLMATHTGNADEESAYDIIDELIDLKTNVDKMSFRGSSASSFLQCILTDVALNAERANDMYETYENMALTIENKRLSVSGVDSDEEAVSLVKYQEAYNLASRMIQVFSEIYEQLILNTGV